MSFTIKVQGNVTFLFNYIDSTTTSKSTAVKEEPSDVLDKAMCLTALAELRHAKWFQVGKEHVLTSWLCYNMLRVGREL